MQRVRSTASILVALTLAACGHSSAASDAPDGAAQDSNAPTSSPDASSGDSSANDAAVPDDAGALDGAPSTPIAWATLWVDGFYGDGGYQGTNVYSHTDTPGAPDGYYTAWRGDPGVTLFANVSDCSSFSDTLLKRSYGWTPPTTNPRALAEDYYWAIRNGPVLTEITNVNDIVAGDVLALLYPPGSSNTGHVAWIEVAPQPFTGPPAETGLSAYVITVIDSNDGFHDGASGPSAAADPRYFGPLEDGGMCDADAECVTLYGANAACDSTSLVNDSVCAMTGVGRGQMRLYADSTGTIQGHTWSPNYASTYYARPSPLPTVGGAFTGEDVVIGRYAQ